MKGILSLDIPQRTISTSLSGWNEFMRSSIWRDMQDAIEDRLTQLFIEYRTLDPSDVGAVSRNQAMITAFEEVLELPVVLKDEVELTIEPKKEEQKDA